MYITHSIRKVRCNGCRKDIPKHTSFLTCTDYRHRYNCCMDCLKKMLLEIRKNNGDYLTQSEKLMEKKI